MKNERKRVKMVNRHTGRPIPDPDTIEGVVNTVVNPLDSAPTHVL